MNDCVWMCDNGALRWTCIPSRAFWDMLQIHCVPDQNKAVTNDALMNILKMNEKGIYIIRKYFVYYHLSFHTLTPN